MTPPTIKSTVHLALLLLQTALYTARAGAQGTPEISQCETLREVVRRVIPLAALLHRLRVTTGVVAAFVMALHLSFSMERKENSMSPMLDRLRHVCLAALDVGMITVFLVIRQRNWAPYLTDLGVTASNVDARVGECSTVLQDDSIIAPSADDVMAVAGNAFGSTFVDVFVYAFVMVLFIVLLSLHSYRPVQWICCLPRIDAEADNRSARQDADMERPHSDDDHCRAARVEGTVSTAPSTCKDSCVICYEEMKNTCIITLECGHAYHQECIHRWVVVFRGKKCPLCLRSLVHPR